MMSSWPSRLPHFEVRSARRPQRHRLPSSARTTLRQSSECRWPQVAGIIRVLGARVRYERETSSVRSIASDTSMTTDTTSALRILSIIPPMTQLNTPYPSTAYLTGFLRSRGFRAAQMDLSIGLALQLLSVDGLHDIHQQIK